MQTIWIFGNRFVGRYGSGTESGSATEADG